MFHVFKSVSEIAEVYFQHGSDSAVLCIVGNKCDADTRQVTLEEGLKVSLFLQPDIIKLSAFSLII